MFCNWDTTYRDTNKKVEDKKADFTPSEIFDQYLPKYHNYHRSYYNTEFIKSVGTHGDNPRDKFTDSTQKVLGNEKQTAFNDNYLLGLGTAKANSNLPGYSGFMPSNRTKKEETNEKNPFIKVAKVNHMINYRIRVPNYAGHVSNNPVNIKGNPRPYCLSTKDEAMN